ncbi:MAG: orotidine-5'-phosphate decarboxylase [Candidatus Omnitrophica bacterium]|jgi:orotidine-5'-phosphate decarboxylase|nr:orotidine-5'-phosphate decarboxylase [Candidatus Omnitrophota bacterium]MDD5079995.1 orotidine-5'-phosphate decarboxylase [Candidatus Omnitrophota bacterium]
MTAVKTIIALDTKDLKTARRFVEMLYPRIKVFKIGPVLFTAYGPKVIEMARKKGAEVFLDLKFHDIPNTVANAVRQAAGLRVKMFTLHTSGGEEMLCRAAQAAQEEAARLKIKKPILLGITVLTSDKSGMNTKSEVVRRAKLAKKAGLDGVVCSVHEAKAVRKACGNNFVIVTPGIRPKGAEAGDQKRIATPKDAIAAGANYIVVGRPITEAEDPLQAAKSIINETG